MISPWPDYMTKEVLARRISLKLAAMDNALCSVTVKSIVHSSSVNEGHDIIFSLSRKTLLGYFLVSSNSSDGSALSITLTSAASSDLLR